MSHTPIDYDRILPRAVVDMPSSGIRKFFDILDSMTDVTALTVGQPDFPTPWRIREAGIESLEAGKTFYTSNAGTMELRREIAKYMHRRFDLSYDAEHEVMVTVGGSEAIDMAMRAVLESGDEVIIPTPCFVCYEPLCKMTGATPVIVKTRNEDKFKLTPELLLSAITERTKLLVLAYPNNPTGAIMDAEDLEKIAEILRDRQIIVLSDEIYAELTYGRRHVSIASLPGMWERTIVVSGFSKAYAMTGWRLGYACAPAPILKQMLKLHQYAIMCAPTTAQLAAIEAMRSCDEDVAAMAAEYDRRRRYIHKGLSDIGIPAFEPEGAFYIYPDIGGFGLTDEEFCERLLFEHKCAIVPGSAFGSSDGAFARISYAYSVKHITQALERMEAFTKKLK